MKFKVTFYIVVLVFVHQIQSQSNFIFDGNIIESGTKKHFKIPISDGEVKTFIPITVFSGVKDGPVLGITAGVHGYEYPPILAGQKLITSIDPKKLKGTVILVQIANLESFQGRSPYKNPLDNKNLNRTFPGKKDGTITEKIADFITKNVIAQSDYFVDIHAGDAPEDLTSYSAYYSNSTLPEVSKKGMMMAKSLLYDYVIVFNTDNKEYFEKDKPSLYCSAEAFKRGIPSVDIECGGLGMPKEKDIKKIEQGVLNMLSHLKMLPSKQLETNKTAYQFITSRTYQESNFTGIFYPSKKSGNFVKKGMILGKVTDYFGKALETIYAQNDGIILYIIGTPPINKGETIVALGDVTKGTK